ncbi:MAG: ABC transporter permease [Muribaculaceae bacterium]
MVIMFPVMVMLVIPLVTTMDVKNVKVAVVDYDHSATSRRLIADMQASPNLNGNVITSTYAQALSAIETGQADVIAQIPRDFERSLYRSQPEAISVWANGVDAMRGSLGAQYLSQSLTGTLADLRAESGRPLPSASTVIRYRFNPTLDYKLYMIPALTVILIIMICGFLPALNLVGEKESGTIEQINVSPVGRTVFTLSKLIPYWIIGMVVLSLAMLIAWAVYGFAPVGSLWLIYAATLLFALVISGLGVAIANCSSTMQQSMYVMFFFVIIFQLMSGLMTPIDSMPAWAQAITYAIPPRYFVEIMRSVYLKGSDLMDLWPNFAALAGFALVFNVIAAATYRKQA